MSAPPGISNCPGIAACLLKLVVASLTLAGCTGMGVEDDWDTAPKLPPLEPVYVEVPGPDLARACGNYPGKYLHGCARRDYEMRACFIYTRQNPPQWLLEHERKHCAGYDHGAPRTFAG